MQEVVVDSHLVGVLDARGVEARPGDMLVVVPQAIDVQWFIDNPAPTDVNAATWAVLTAPNRREGTRGVINEALRELRELERHLKNQIRLAHRDAARSPMLRQALPFTTADQATRVDQCRQIMQSLTGTRDRMERVHLTLTRRRDTP